MTDSEFQLACLRDARLAVHVTAALPAWLWSADASAVPWSNAVAAAIFGASTPAVLARRRFDSGQPTAAQIATLAGTLPTDGAARIERLRGLGAGVGRTLACVCSRISLADGSQAILIAATERAGPDLPPAERARRALADIDAPLAIFTADGKRLHATKAAAQRLGAASLAGIGADGLVATARDAGHAEGQTEIGAVAITRLGDDGMLLVDLAPPAASAAPAAQPELPLAAAAPEPPEPPAAPEPATEPPPPETAAEPAADAPSEPPGADDMAAPDESARVLQILDDARARMQAYSAPQEPEDAKAETADDTPPVAPQEPSGERRHPLRFVWQLDDGERFTLDSDEFLALVGPQTAAVLGRPWSEVAASLGLDPEGQVARAIASRDTWSGITVSWPVDGAAERLSVELSGLPVVDRTRGFRGYRGFGICRDLAQIAGLMQARAAAPSGDAQQGDAAEADTQDHETQAASAPAESAPAGRPSEERPVLTLVPASRNVLPFRPASPAADAAATLSPVERKAFRELARQLTARLKGPQKDAAAPAEPDDFDALLPGQPVAEPAAPPVVPEMPAAETAIPEAQAAPEPDVAPDEEPAPAERPILDRLPIGVLVYRHEQLCYANRAFLDWAGHPHLHAMAEAGGLETLGLEPGSGAEGGGAKTIALSSGDKPPVQARLFTVPWDGDDASVLMLESTAASERQRAQELALRLAEGDISELKSILDTATDGVLVLDRTGQLLSANRSAEALFGYEAHELAGKPLVTLFAPESERAALDYLDGLTRNGVASVLNDGREVIGRVRGGGLIPLFMTMGRIADGTEKLCVVLRDITNWKKAEEELTNAKRQAEKASSAKSDFLAKISHEIRTPLNAIIGFSEVMMDERFGPVGNERYREYLKDIHASGGHLVSLINDLLDLSKIEAGKLELTFASVNINDLTQQCVAIMQAQANRERIIIRSSLPQKLPQIVADARSVRQIVLNLLSNSIKFTGPGGQVIVSTALTDDGEVVLRVRDTGAGMSEQDIATALEPFRQLATSARWGSGGTGLGLPLTKALAEANRANFMIKSAVNAGTLVEIAFPATRVLAE